MAAQATDDMRFRLVGGYAVVQGPDKTGLVIPPLLAPPFVQELFTAAQSGGTFWYPSPNGAKNGGGQLCRFIARYDVGAVVFWDQGVDPKLVKSFLLDTLGAPTKTGGSGTDSSMVWLTKPYAHPGTCS
jgi:hypothetical protein